MYRKLYPNNENLLNNNTASVYDINSSLFENNAPAAFDPFTTVLDTLSVVSIYGVKFNFLFGVNLNK
jgi:hypothetical protein